MTDVAPPAPRADAPPRIKLRSACDRCSLNKIKCSQDKPECQRCKTIGVQCHYSRSMRMGKPRKSAKAKAMAEKSGNTQENSPEANVRSDSNATTVSTSLWQQKPFASPEACSDLHLPSNPHHHTDLHWSADWNFDSVLAGHELQPLFDSPAEIAPTAYSQQSDDSFLAASQSPGSGGQNVMLKDDPENVYLSPSSYYAPSFDASLLLSTPATTATGASTPEGLSPSMFQPQASKPHDCTQLALETLVSLSLPSTVQKTSQGQPRPTMDQVLKANSEAMKNVSTLLSCSCPKDSSFPMFLATIFSKTLAWYQAAVDFNDVSLLDGTTEEVEHRPISVGGYELDDESCDLMKVQLVLSRLRMMVKPLKQYLELYALSPSDTKPAVSVVTAVQVFSTVGTFLQSRLQSTIDDLQSKLSN